MDNSDKSVVKAFKRWLDNECTEPLKVPVTDKGKEHTAFSTNKKRHTLCTAFIAVLWFRGCLY